MVRERGVTAIFDITNSGVALALQNLAKSHNRLVVFNSASSSDLTGKSCSPYTMQWNADNWSNGVALMRLLVKQKLDSFFFITADYAFGASLEADARAAIAEAGGTTVGGVRAPLNTADFSSYLLSAQASHAKVVVLANTGADLSTSLKQANEFGVTPAQYIAAPITYLSDVNALGLAMAHDLTFMQSWYWDLNDATRAWAKRFYDRTQRMPNDNQAVLYSSVRHYLEAVAKAGTDDALDRRQGDARRADPRRLHRQRPHPRGRPRRLRPLPDESEDCRRVEISLGLSQGGRQDPRRSSVPPAGGRRLQAWRPIAARAAKAGRRRARLGKSAAEPAATRPPAALRFARLVRHGKALTDFIVIGGPARAGPTGTRCGSPSRRANAAAAPATVSGKPLSTSSTGTRGSWEGGEGR